MRFVPGFSFIEHFLLSTVVVFAWHSPKRLMVDVLMGWVCYFTFFSQSVIFQQLALSIGSRWMRVMVLRPGKIWIDNWEALLFIFLFCYFEISQLFNINVEVDRPLLFLFVLLLLASYLFCHVSALRHYLCDRRSLRDQEFILWWLLTKQCLMQYFQILAFLIRFRVNNVISPLFRAVYQ